jgi:hypothetical protein
MVELFEVINACRVPVLHLTSILLAAAIWRWGGAPERWLIGIFFGTMVLPVYPILWLGVQALETGPAAPVGLMIDLAAAGLFMSIALQANRNYPLWIAGFQLVAVTTHVVRTLIDGISPLAIALLVIGPSYCQLLLILGGFLRHTSRSKRFGPYREWRTGAGGLQWWRA